MSRDLVIGMAGSGGDGIVSAGESLFSAAAAQGYHAILTKSFGPQIRGGESSCRIRAALDGLHNPGGLLDAATALSLADFRRFGGDLPLGPDSLLVHDADDDPTHELNARPAPPPTGLRAVPFGALAREATGTEEAKNGVVLGLLCGGLDLDPDAILAGMTRRWSDKGEASLEANLRAFETGRRHAAAAPLNTPRHLERPPAGSARPDRLTLDGNDMCAAAAIHAGCQVFSGYPITPSSEVMQHLADELWRFGGAMLQAEDEIAGIGVALGASFAGKKAMTATSGPGLPLKPEMLGLASIAELERAPLDPPIHPSAFADDPVGID